MSTFRLSRFFSQPEILRRIDPRNLLSLLARHAAALEALGLTLPDEAAVGLDHARLVELLMTPEKLPAALRDAFYFIHELATEEGMACLLDAAEKAGLEIVGQPAPTPADVAVQVWLRNPELLERTHAEQFLRNPRTFESFATAVTPVPKHRDAAAAAARMKADLDDFFEKRKRGRNSKVFAYVRPDGVWFLVRHGDPFKREGAIDERGESVGVYYWPEKFDVLVLDPVEGELRINARNQGEKRAYRQVFGRHLYGDDGFFGGEDKYTLEPLRERGEDALTPVEGMEQAVLVEVHFCWGGSHNEREIRKADDVFAAYRARGREFPAKPRIVKACFRVTFTDSETPRMVTVKPPNVAQYTRDADSVIVERWMKARGFIAQKGQAPRDATLRAVLAGT